MQRSLFAYRWRWPLRVHGRSERYFLLYSVFDVPVAPYGLFLQTTERDAVDRESMVRARDDKEVRGMAKTHYFPEDQVHYVWDNEQEPVLTVEPGDTVVYHTREVSDGQIGPDSDVGALDGLDWDRLYPLAGPVAMVGAE